MIQSPPQQEPQSPPNAHRRVCRLCRARKIKCDKAEPICASCATQERHCAYTYERPKPRPSSAIILDLKNSAPEEVTSILRRVTIVGGSVQLPTSTIVAAEDANQNEQRHNPPLRTPEKPRSESRTSRETHETDETEGSESDGDFDVSRYLSVDDHEHVDVFGLTSTLLNPRHASLPNVPPIQDVRN